ncbi:MULTISPECIES: hypothetical protein [Arcobacteraceae]|uniref:hypothetical protein n=1 Tax=Arcobacteraceae TaxID=2808963 RepID=UPI000825D2CE|nr:MULTISPECIES: hypothetical protein [Arcobacteraceae]
MSQKLQIKLQDDSQKVLDRLLSNRTKSLFVNLAIIEFANTELGSKFLSELNKRKENKRI